MTRTFAGVLPVAAGNLNVNFCRNAGCRNFGVPPDLSLPSRRGRRPRDWVAEEVEIGRYRLTNINPVSLRCDACTGVGTFFSNEGLAEELQRQTTRNGVLTKVGCPNIDCVNYGRPARRHPELYHRHGKTKTGNPRFKCSACEKTFTLTPVRGNRKTRPSGVKRNSDDVAIWNALVNGVSINSICRMTNRKADDVYRRIRHIHRQAMAFEQVQLREAKWPRDRSYAISSDFQDYIVNWSNRADRRNVQLTAIASVENRSGFVLAHDLAFDPRVKDTGLVENEVALALEIGFERFNGPAAQYRLRLDSQNNGGSNLNHNLALPHEGLLVQKTYTAIAHFHRLNDLLPAEINLNLNTDFDGSIVAAIMAGFTDRITSDHVSIAAVQIDKQLTKSEKTRRKNAYEKRVEQFWRNGRATTTREANRLILHEAIANHRPGQTHGAMVRVPLYDTSKLSTMYEPSKKIGLVHLPRTVTSSSAMVDVMEVASLYGVDTWFNWLRQRVSYLERPHFTPNSSSSLWYPKAAYKPEMISLVLDIARVHFNWVEARKRERRVFAGGSFQKEHSEKTPAMRFGLAAKPIALHTIFGRDWLARL